MVSLSNLKSDLSNPSRIFKIEAVEAVKLRFIKRVYFFDSPGRLPEDLDLTIMVNHDIIK